MCKIVYSPVNQAWFVLWYQQVVRILTNRDEAIDVALEMGIEFNF